MFIFNLPPIDRRIEKEDLTSYVEKKREMFLLQVRLVHYEVSVSQISSAHNYEERDVELAKEVYSVVERSGGSGVTESDVVKVIPVRECDCVSCYIGPVEF